MLLQAESLNAQSLNVAQLEDVAAEPPALAVPECGPLQVAAQGLWWSSGFWRCLQQSWERVQVVTAEMSGFQRAEMPGPSLLTLSLSSQTAAQSFSK